MSVFQVRLAGWSGGARSCGALLESHLSVAELLDRLCPGRGPRCYCSLFEGHAELLDRWQPICNILVLQSRLCAVELLDCIWQYASLARLITNRRATCGQAEHLKVWCSNPGIVGMSARTTSLNCMRRTPSTASHAHQLRRGARVEAKRDHGLRAPPDASALRM